MGRTRTQGPRHAGPRRHSSGWWRGHWPPTILLLAGMALLAWELSWAVMPR